MVIKDMLYDYVGRLCVEALMKEASLTPKPGLVDRQNCGAHKDMDYDMLMMSAHCLENYFKNAARAGRDMDSISLRKYLWNLGIAANQYMLETTHGVNTHKGAIWCLGLIVAGVSRAAACSWANADCEPVDRILNAAGEIARMPIEGYVVNPSHGKQMLKKYGVKGAVYEAQNNFPHIKTAWKYFQNEKNEQGTPEGYLGNTLLYLMGNMDDTCVYYRGGKRGASWFKERAVSLLRQGGYRLSLSEIERFDRECIEKNISAGGAADMLSVIIFLDSILREDIMENLAFKYKGSKHIYKSVCTGVAASGNLEVLIEPSESDETHVHITTKIDGNGEIWKYLIDDFMESYPICADIDINDGGAVPGAVELRLKQAAAEVLS
jgi:triphosphoribosyl-dephospho-CoA synthase